MRMSAHCNFRKWLKVNSASQPMLIYEIRMSRAELIIMLKQR